MEKKPVGTGMKSLKQIEAEVLAEGREWTRRLLEERLKMIAEKSGDVSPLDGQRVERRVRREVVLQTTVGEVRVEAWYGRRRSDGQWIYPLKEVWELGARETRSPELKDRLAHIISLTGTFEEAAALARRMDLPGDDSTLHTLAGRLGQECMNQLELALDRPEAVDSPAAKHDPEDPLVVMMDGWMAWFRGPDWGSRTDSESQAAVLWQEIKMPVSYRLGQALEKGRRGWLSEKPTLMPPRNHESRAAKSIFSVF